MGRGRADIAPAYNSVNLDFGLNKLGKVLFSRPNSRLGGRAIGKWYYICTYCRLCLWTHTVFYCTSLREQSSYRYLGKDDHAERNTHRDT
jgi:hypothetical protein